VLASLDNQDLNVVWAVSSKARAMATATKPTEKKNDDPPGLWNFVGARLRSG